MATRLYTHPVFLEHLTPPGHPERPDRLRAVERVLDDEAFSALDRVKAPEGDEATILYAHPEDFVARVRAAIPETGIVSIDADTSASPKSWQAAVTAIGAANAAVDDVFEGRAANVFVAARPPGHHAEKTTAMGFCLFNTAAIAARYAQKQHQAERVAIVDWDVHHGNGTQGIFYARPDVLTVSLHADPVRFYPFFWGYADERGEGAGLGYNLNLPLPRKSGDAAFLEALVTAFRRIRAFAPEALVVALGLDAFEGDPFGGLSVTTPGFSRIGEAIAGLGLPTVIVQEGGYLCDALSDNLTAFLTGFGGKQR
ncbi:MAG: histone deacetylase family protein [Mesorhizobium sp.]|nr:MAG: histone deacetylase family protein [Mesorhizobium sp.]